MRAKDANMFDLTGKTALVTGASGGIGGAIAKALYAQGATVVLSGTRQEALDALKAELDSIGGSGRAFTATCNLSDIASVEALVKTAEEAAGSGIDILVNNAGITRDNLFMRMKDEEWDQVIAVNLTAAFRLSRAVLRGMMKKRWGRIIQITSVVRASDTSFQVKWDEQSFEHGALSTTERWTALLTLVIEPPRTTDKLRKNPLGIYINGLAWSRELDPSQVQDERKTQ